MLLQDEARLLDLLIHEEAMLLQDEAMLLDLLIREEARLLHEGALARTVYPAHHCANAIKRNVRQLACRLRILLRFYPCLVGPRCLSGHLAYTQRV